MCRRHNSCRQANHYGENCRRVPFIRPWRYLPPGHGRFVNRPYDITITASFSSVVALHEAPVCTAAVIETVSLDNGVCDDFVGRDDPARLAGRRCRHELPLRGVICAAAHRGTFHVPTGTIHAPQGAIHVPQAQFMPSGKSCAARRNSRADRRLINNPNSPRTGRFSRSIPFAAPPFRPLRR